jgi:uncharacterized spore protein YtfJ
MAKVIKTLGALGDRLQAGASVRNVYGDPVELHGRTVIPVARIGYGFGAGGRASGGKGGGSEPGASGGGAGLSARPVGVLEIAAGRTRFIPFVDPARLGMVLMAGVLIGLVLGRRSRTNVAKSSR